jgi:hypothetical protein
MDHSEYREQAKRPKVRFALDAYGHLSQVFINDEPAAVQSVTVHAQAAEMTTCEIDAGPASWVGGLPNTKGEDPLIIEGYLVPTEKGAQALEEYLEAQKAKGGES